MSQESFAALGVSAKLIPALEAHGISVPFHIQTRAIPPALAGTYLLAKSPTGSGKTLAFALPIVERTEPGSGRPAALVLVPTRELALQVTEELRSLAASRSLAVAAVYGGVPVPAQAKRAKTAHVLVATPGRLQDLMERRLVALDAVRILVLDEADRMLDMGFKPQVDRIVRRLPRNRQTMLFSATLGGNVDDLVASYTDNPIRVEGRLPAHAEPADVEHLQLPRRCWPVARWVAGRGRNRDPVPGPAPPLPLTL